MAKMIVNRSRRFIAKHVHLNQRTVEKAMKNRNLRLKRKSGINAQAIKDFYKREDISRVLPLKRYTTKD